MPEVRDLTHISVDERKETIIERSSMILAKRYAPRSYTVMWGGAAEGRPGDWGEVVTR